MNVFYYFLLYYFQNDTLLLTLIFKYVRIFIYISIVHCDNVLIKFNIKIRFEFRTYESLSFF